MRIQNVAIMTIFLVIGLCRYACADFEISVNGRFLEFGLMELGEFKEIKDSGDYQNEVTCKSDRGHTWYLKIHLVRPLSSMGNEIDIESFKWKVVNVVNGTGYATNINEFNSFSKKPMVVYTSSPDESDGREVTLRFIYGLKIPQTTLTGNYQAGIRYTFTETL